MGLGQLHCNIGTTELCSGKEGVTILHCKNLLSLFKTKMQYQSSTWAQKGGDFLRQLFNP